MACRAEFQKYGDRRLHRLSKRQVLWQFVLPAHVNRQFSAKQPEKNFDNAAYVSIRDFLLKFEKLGLLRSVKYDHRIKYQIAN